MDLNIIRSFLNDGGETAGGAADENAGRYGAVGLYVNGTGEVSFKDFGYKDLAMRSTPEEKTAFDSYQSSLRAIFYREYDWQCFREPSLENPTPV